MGNPCDVSMTLLKYSAIAGNRADRRRLGPVARMPDKKKPAGKSGLKTIFLEENSGDKT